MTTFDRNVLEIDAESGSRAQNRRTASSLKML